MNLLSLVMRSLRQHALSTVVTAGSIALAAGLLMSVWVVKNQSQAVFTGVTGGFDAVLGARGSKLQLVLNAVFHLEASPGNMAWSDYLGIRSNRFVAFAAPIAVGDNFHGYRLAGTTPEYFEKAEYAAGRRFELEEGGRWFAPEAREAVVGAFAARRLGLRPGDTFHPFHGLVYDEGSQHEETYVVTGILKPSNTPADRVIWTPLEGVQTMSGHDPKAASEISAVLVKLKAGSATAGFQLDMLYNKQGSRLTFAWPIGRVVAELFEKVGWFDRVLELVAYLVAAIATGTILAGIYNSMNERRREIAILRALGARRVTVFAAIVLEASTIAALGVAAGFAVYAVILGVVAAIVRTQTGVVLDPLKFDPVMLWAPALLIGLGGLSGVVPALKAYRTDVASSLAPVS